MRGAYCVPVADLHCAGGEAPQIPTTYVGPWAPRWCLECRLWFPPNELEQHIHPMRETNLLRAWDAAFIQDAWRDVEREFPDTE